MQSLIFFAFNELVLILVRVRVSCTHRPTPHPCLVYKQTVHVSLVAVCHRSRSLLFDTRSRSQASVSRFYTDTRISFYTDTRTSFFTGTRISFLYRYSYLVLYRYSYLVFHRYSYLVFIQVLVSRFLDRYFRALVQISQL